MAICLHSPRTRRMPRSILGCTSSSPWRFQKLWSSGCIDLLRAAPLCADSLDMARHNRPATLFGWQNDTPSDSKWLACQGDSLKVSSRREIPRLFLSCLSHLFHGTWQTMTLLYKFSHKDLRQERASQRAISAPALDSSVCHAP